MSEESSRRESLSETPATDGQTPDEGGLPGPTLPRYQILGPVGLGGMGVVYRAEDTLLGRTVALKFLPPMLTPNPRAKARFLNEARAAAALDHPNICTLYEVGETAEGQLYLAMAYYKGETLKQRLDRGLLPVAEALHLALQVARGLAKAHQNGVVHRDIKPANLMITADGIVKILDFGIAQLPDQDLSGPLLGTLGYMSPEQTRGEAVDARTDVWSLGVLFREMLTGRRPGGGQPNASSGQEPPVSSLRQEVPSGVDTLLSRMLAEEPADRYPNAAALLPEFTALERAAAGTEITSTLALSRRRVPVRAIVVLSAMALIVAVGSWLLWGVRRQDETGPDPSHATFKRLTYLPGKEWFPSLSPDGDFFVYVRKFGDRSRLFLQQVGGDTPLDLPRDSVDDDSQPAISPDGHQIAFRSEREGGGIFVMALTGESVRRVTEFGFNPAWSPDGKEIVFATEGIEDPRSRRHTSALYRVKLTGQRRLIHRGDAVQPSWSPHGFRIAYWSGYSPSGERVIWTLPADGGAAVRVTSGKSIDWNPVWSPDGHFLYFSSNRSGVTNLWRLPIDERSGRVLGKPAPVATSGPTGMLLSLSSDGRQIAYTSDETRTILEKVAFDPASDAIASPTTIVDTPDMIATLDASRDGRWLVYQTSVPQEDLFVVRSDGIGSVRRLTHDEFNDRQPRWSPDGTRIAFYSNRSGKYEVWIIRADGSHLERVTVTSEGRIAHPIWSPDGRWLACDLGEKEALVDLTRPLEKRQLLLLPPAGRGMAFSASSWSADGRWLAGDLQQPDGQHVPGVVLYSLAERSYVRITDRGQWATWLSDSRYILYRDGDKLFLLDTLSRASRQVLTIPAGSEYNDFSLSPDDRLYSARSTEQSDIWLLTMK